MKNFKTIDPQDLTTREVHQILLNAVTPRPIALASTIDKNGNVKGYITDKELSVALAKTQVNGSIKKN